MASRFVLPFADVGNGISPSDGAQLFFFESGTSTPKDTYSDDALSTPNANPVVSDSDGIFSDIFLDGEPYKVQLKDKNGVQQWEADPVVVSSSGVNYKQGGTGSVNRSIESKLQELVSVKDFGAKGDGSTDDTASIQAAITYAIANNFEAVYIPAGTYIVSSTINVGRCKVYGAGDGSRLKPTISDGSAVLNITAGTNLYSLEDFRIDSGIVKADFLTGAINAQNCTGIIIDESGGSFSARWHLKNVLIFGCKIGYDIQAFIGSMENLWAIACETGLTGTAMNAVRINGRIEECRKDYAITASNGIHFDQLMCEGDVHQSGLVSSTIDGVSGIEFSAPYFEQKRNVPFVTFGGTTECKGVILKGGSVGVADDAANDYDIFPIAFDQVDGLTVEGFFSTGSHHKLYSTTTNTKNIVDNSASASDDDFGPHDLSLSMSPALNYFPNPNFDLWFRGWPNVTIVRGTISQETTTVRKGKNAVKLTIDAAQTVNTQLSFVLNDAAMTPSQLAGKTISAYAWVWVPNTADFDPNDLSAQKMQPSIGIFTNGTGGTTTLSGTHHTSRGQWNLMKVTAPVPSDATRIDLLFTISVNSGSAAGTEHIIIDSVYIIEDSLAQLVHVKNGWVKDSDMNPVSSIGGKMIQRVTSIPSDADMSYEVGDQFLLNSPSAGGFIGNVVTTAGTGATMVTKTFGSITA